MELNQNQNFNHISMSSIEPLDLRNKKKEETKIINEQEMRETSYFKNQADDEGKNFAAVHNDIKNLNKKQKQQIIEPVNHKDNKDTFELPKINQNSNRNSKQVNSYNKEIDQQQIKSNLYNLNQPQNITQKGIENSIGNLQIIKTNTEQISKNEKDLQEQNKINSIKDGIKMFKIQSKSQLRWNRQSKNKNNEKKESTDRADHSNYEHITSLLSNDDGYNNLNVQTEIFADLNDQFQNNTTDVQYVNSANLYGSKSPLNINKLQVGSNEFKNETDVKKVKDNHGDQVYSPKSKIKIQQIKNNYKKNLFESDKLPLKMISDQENEFMENENIKFQDNQNGCIKQMFTSMSDIGFPQNIHQYNMEINKQNLNSKKELDLKGQQNDLITLDQIQKLMNTQNNWRVRTTTIDQILHDIQQKVQDDQEYILQNSEKYLDFFVQMLGDQNFKIVLNTLNLINIIVGLKEQKLRYQKIMKIEPESQNKQSQLQWGLSNSCLAKHIPQIVKKLSDSKNIIRQEASKSLFYMNEIMRSGNKKENNFVALILPYLNNSSNWHIREELLNLLIKNFLTLQDKNEFSPVQVLDSIVRQLINDSNDEIRSLALESVVAFASVFYKSAEKNIIEIIGQLTDNKEILEIINKRLDSGMFPILNDQQLEFPYFENQQLQNYDVDSVAQSITNQTQASQGGNSYLNKQNVNTSQIQQKIDIYNKRKQSIGAQSSQNGQNTRNQSQNESAVNKNNINRGNSSGRKIFVATANASNIHNSHLEDMQNESYQTNKKRTASENNPNFNFNNKNFAKSKHNPSNSFNLSTGVVILQHDTKNHLQDRNHIDHNLMISGHEQYQLQQQQYMDDIMSIGKNNYSINSHVQENGSNFLPQLQKKQKFNIQQKPFSQFSNHSEHRNVGSGGGIGLHGQFKSGELNQFQINKQGDMIYNNHRQGLQLFSQLGIDIQLPSTKVSKRNNKTTNQQSTPIQTAFSYQKQNQKGINLAQNHFNRGNSGKLMGNHQIICNQSEQSPQLFIDNRFQASNLIMGSEFSQNPAHYNYNGIQENQIGGIIEERPAQITRQNIDQINDNHSKQISALSGSLGNTSNINQSNIIGYQNDQMHNIYQQKIMSENGFKIENSDVFSIAGMQSHQSTYNYNNMNTPSQYNHFNQHDQIVYSASSGYRQQIQGSLFIRMNDNADGQTQVQNNYELQNQQIQTQGQPEFGFEVDETAANSSFNFINSDPNEKFTPDHSIIMQTNDFFILGSSNINNKNKLDMKNQMIFSEQQNTNNNHHNYLNVNEHQNRIIDQNQAFLNNIYSISGQGSANGAQRNQILLSGDSNNKISGVVKKFQNGQSTFYSNGTNVTGITGTTAATGGSGNPLIAQNKEIVNNNQSNDVNSEVYNQQQIFRNNNSTLMSQNSKSSFQQNDQNPNQSQNKNNIQQQQNQLQAIQRQDPIKAARFSNIYQKKQQISLNHSSLNQHSKQNQQEQQNELVIDTRRIKVGKQNSNIQSLNANNGNPQNTNKNLIQLNSKIVGSQTLDNDPILQIVASSSTQNIDQNQNWYQQQFKKTDGSNLISDINFVEQSQNIENSLNFNEEQDLSQTFQIVYTQFDDLEALEKPEQEFKKSLSKGNGIYSNDWIKQFEGCQIIRQVCKHHQSLIIQTANQLQNLVTNLIKLVDSLRSAVSCISLMTLNEMFISLKRVMEPCLDPIMKILLKKSSDTSNFIAEVADQCLLSLVQNCQEQKVLQILQLQNMNSRSNLYRLKICQCLQNIVKQLGNNILFFNQNDKLLVLLANYLHDPNQDVRQSAKTAFVCMSQQIMGQNELEKLLQRVLNEVQYKKVKEYLDKEPQHLGGNQSSQIDFVITNANNNNQNVHPYAKKIIPGNKHQNHKQSQKNIKQQQNQTQQNNQNFEKNGQTNISQYSTAIGVSELQNQEKFELNIHSKQLINPLLIQKQEQNGKSLYQQNKNGNNIQSQQQIQNLQNNGAGNLSQRGLAIPNSFYQAGIQPQSKNINIDNEICQNNTGIDQFFIDSLKDCILKTQINDWRSRLEASEVLFDFIKTNNDKVQNNLKSIELSEAISKLLNDANAKIQISSLENLQKLMNQIFQYIKNNILPFYKSLLTNLGSSNVGVRKISDQLIRQLNENLNQDRIQYLLPPLVQIIQKNNNLKLKASLLDQLQELLQDYSQIQNQQLQDQILMSQPSITQLIQNQIPQLAFKLLEDNKNDSKVRCEKLLKKLYNILGQQQLFDKCPQNKLQKVSEICLSSGLISQVGQQSSSQITNDKINSSQNLGTGTFGANGSSLVLNSRV